MKHNKTHAPAPVYLHLTAASFKYRNIKYIRGHMTSAMPGNPLWRQLIISC